MTIQEALANGCSQFQASAQLREEALQDAAYLLRHTLNISQASMIAYHDRILTPGEQADYERLVSRRLTHEPIAYITGEREFYGLPLRVTRAVLIPRNTTELLVECVLEEMRSHATECLRIADVGTGSGAIAIALAHHLPLAQVTALDVSREALEVAASNAAISALGDRIRFAESDLLAAVFGEPAFHAVVSNPPYIPLGDRDGLHPQVRDFEPEISLYGGPAGLDIYQRLLPQAHVALLPNGLLAMEIGYGQREAILDLLAGWNDVRFVDDLEHTPRVVLARKA